MINLIFLKDNANIINEEIAIKKLVIYRDLV